MPGKSPPQPQISSPTDVRRGDAQGAIQQQFAASGMDRSQLSPAEVAYLDTPTLDQAAASGGSKPPPGGKLPPLPDAPVALATTDPALQPLPAKKALPPIPGAPEGQPSPLGALDTPPGLVAPQNGGAPDGRKRLPPIPGAPEGGPLGPAPLPAIPPRAQAATSQGEPQLQPLATDQAALLLRQDPRKVLTDVGLSWNGAKSAFAKDPALHPVMKYLIGYRKQTIDGLANKMTQSFQGVTWKSVGSESLTSDYDLTFKGGDEVLAVETFNNDFRADFGKEPGSVFDTNAYTAGSFVPGTVKKGDEGVDENAPVDKDNQVLSGKKNGRGDDLVQINDVDQKFEHKNAAEEDEQIQDIASLVKTRKFMTDPEWETFKQAQLDGVTSVKSKMSIGRRFRDAEKMYDKAEKDLEAKMAELDKTRDKDAAALGEAPPPGEKKERDPELELQASNLLYVERLKLAQQAAQRRDEHRASMKVPPLDHEVALLEQLIVIAKEKQSAALMFANEPYFSEGAIRHVVGGQAKMDIDLSAQNLLSSFQEQLGDTLKDLHHYEDDFVEAAVKSSKYADRLMQAAQQLSSQLGFGLPSSAGPLAQMSSDLLKIRRDEKISGNDRESKALGAIGASNLIPQGLPPKPDGEASGRHDVDQRVTALRGVMVTFGCDVTKGARSAIEAKVPPPTPSAPTAKVA